jgi:hypothetical protein
MSALYILGRGTAFCSCRAMCHISTSRISMFFLKLLDAFMDMREDYIKLPGNVLELNRAPRLYASVSLPGACGLIDVVHIKWSSCTTGDCNRAKGKEGYTTLGFQVITNFNQRILGVYGPQFRTANNNQNVKTDSNKKTIRLGWFKDVWWCCYMEDGCIRHERGVYIIWDNGYLHCPSSICSYEGHKCATLEGDFSSNLESVCKDFECTFGILKKQWKILNNGLLYQDICVCKIFCVMCCCLHNFLLDLMARNNVRVGHGYPIGKDGLWLDGHTIANKDKTERFYAITFGQQRALLAKHLRVFYERGPIPE